MESWGSWSLPAGIGYGGGKHSGYCVRSGCLWGLLGKAVLSGRNSRKINLYSIVILLDTIDKHADVAELVDALDLGSSALVA